MSISARSCAGVQGGVNLGVMTLETIHFGFVYTCLFIIRGKDVSEEDFAEISLGYGGKLRFSGLAVLHSGANQLSWAG